MNDSWLDPPLRRDGTSRRERILPALDPATAPIDGRSRGQLLAYLCSISAGVRWYRESRTAGDSQVEAVGDWQVFFERDPAVRAAVLAHGPEPWNRGVFESLRSSAQTAVDAGVPQADLAKELLAVFKLLDVAFGVLAQRTSGSTPASPFGSEIQSLIKETFVPSLEAFLALAEEGWFAAVGFDAGRSFAALFAWVWNRAKPPGPTAEALASLVIDPVTVARVLARLDLIHSNLLAAAARLRQAALDAGTLEVVPDGSHAPHVALLLAYLDAFAVLRSEVDQLTERHLRNYYRKRLAQTKLPVEPDRAHVVFTLARGETSAALSAGRELLAGTERFALLHDTIIDRTEIAALRSTYEASDGVVRIATEADSADGAGAALADPASGYDAFGHEALTQVAPLGFAIAAPSLLQTGGTKVVTLTIALSAPLPADLANPTRLKSGFRVEFTGKKGWVVADDVTATVGSDPTHFDLAFVVTADIAIVGLDAETHAVSLDTTWPVLRCTLDQQLVHAIEWAGVRVTKITCTIHVQDDANVVVVTDSGPANPQKPFQPFGPMPSVGSRFAVGSVEVFRKRLHSLAFAWTWRDLAKVKFTLRPAFLDRGAWQPLPELNLELAADSPRSFEPDLSFAGESGETFENPLTWKPDESLPTFDDIVVGLSRGFVRFELTSPPSAFGHREYPGLVAVAMTTALLTKSELAMPSPPWTPVISAVSLSHSATDTVTLGMPESGSLRFFQLGPHGFREATGKSEPELIAQSDADAEFLIGVSGFERLANLRVLVQLVHGSEDPFAEFPAVSWSCLVGDEWHPLTSTAIPRDETSTMRRSGIVEFIVPEDAHSTCTWMPPGSIWLRAAAKGDPKAIPRVAGVHSRAATTQRVVNASSAAPSVVPLVAKSLSKLAVRERAIKTVEQPYASFGGRAKELEPGFRLRIADRLRHRARAIDVSDYERLVLQEFPQVYRVKCLPHTDRWSSRAPGSILIVVVPRLDNPHARDPRRPALGQADLESIRVFVRSRCNWLVNVDVVNATFEQLKVEVDVALRGGDTGWYESVLGRELQAFFAPWLATKDADILFGASIHRSEILHFIEQRDYVDWVTKLRVLQFADDHIVAEDVERFAPTSERAVLVGHLDQVVKALPAGECP